MNIKKYITVVTVLIFSICFIMPSSVLAGEGELEPLTIEDALQTAYKNNPDLRKADLEVEKAQIQRDDAADMIDYSIPSGNYLVIPKVQQLINGYQQADINLNAKKKARNQAKDGTAQAVVDAYNDAVKAYNQMETVRLMLEDMQQQMKARSAAKAVGLMADFDYEKAKTGMKELEESYKAAQSSYEGKIAALRSLLGESRDWQPQLSSRAVITDYERDDLALELSHGLSNAVQVWSSEAKLDVEKSMEDWIIPGISSDMQHINTGLAEADYEKSKRDAKAMIEQLYYGLDALEGQIDAAEVAYGTAQRDLELAELKYEVGMISLTSIMPGTENLSSARLEAEKKRLELENLKADLAATKSKFALLTGQAVYENEDWNSPTIEG